MITWDTVRENYANACSFLRQTMGAIGYASLLVSCTGLGWYLGGVFIGGVGFLIALGIAFILMDVGNIPSDSECAERQQKRS